jgi:hypothetical protein
MIGHGSSLTFIFPILYFNGDIFTIKCPQCSNVFEEKDTIESVASCPQCTTTGYIEQISSNYPYNFNEVIWVSRNNIWEQFWHLLSEVFEVFIALIKKDYKHASKELWDVSHSSETLNRILQQKHNINPSSAYVAIINNNMNRQYYLHGKKG